MRLILVGVAALDAFLIFLIATTGGGTFSVGGAAISARGVQNPMLFLWLILLAWVLTKWRVKFRLERPGAEMFWRGAQAVMIAVATFAVVCLPLVVQAFRLAVSGRYVSQTYFWRSAPRGIDALAPALGNPFHPLFGGLATGLYERLGLDRIEAVGWLGVVPFVVLLMGRGKWSDVEEARRWKVVLCVFAVWALGPFLTIAGFDAGLPLPQALARFVPVVENARMPGRAIVGVYLALGVLMVLRVAGHAGPKPRPTDARTSVAQGFSPGYIWVLFVLLVLDYLPAPIPLTALDRPAVYEQLGTIDDSGAVIEVPFGIGDGLSTGPWQPGAPAAVLRHDSRPSRRRRLYRPHAAERRAGVRSDAGCGKSAAALERRRRHHGRHTGWAAIPLPRPRYEHGVARIGGVRARHARHGPHHVGRREAVVCGAGDAAVEPQSVATMMAKQMAPDPSASHPHPRVAGTCHHM